MKRNLTEMEQRLTAILKKDSRKSISDIADELGTSRVTARKVLDSLMESGKIKAFTVRLDVDETDMAVVRVADREKVPDDLVIEEFQLLDGTSLLVVYYEDLMKLDEVRIMDVRIARKRIVNDDYGRMEDLHCDLCGSEIRGSPVRVTVNRRVYYACCPTCEKGLRRKLVRPPT